MNEIVNNHDFKKVQVKLKKLALEGKELANNFSSRVRKYKRFTKKRKVG